MQFIHSLVHSCMEQMDLLCAPSGTVGTEWQSPPETTGCCVYVWGVRAEGAWVFTLDTQVSRNYHEGGFEAVTQLESVWVKLSGCLAVYGRERRKSVMLILLMQILVFCSLRMFAFIMIFKILHYNIRSDCWAFLVNVWSCTAEMHAQPMSCSPLSLLVYFWLLKFLRACSWDPTIWTQGLQTYK